MESRASPSRSVVQASGSSVVSCTSLGVEARLRSFSIQFAGPHTAEGIGVGSTFRDVRSAYRRLGADDNEGRVYVWPEPDRDISFALSVGRDALKPGWRQAPTTIPDSAHVIELLIRAPLRKS